MLRPTAAPPPTSRPGKPPPVRLTGSSSSGPAHPAANAAVPLQILPNAAELSEKVATRVLAQVTPQLNAIASKVADDVAARMSERIAASVAKSVDRYIDGKVEESLRVTGH